MKIVWNICVLKNYWSNILFWVFVSENQSAFTQIDNGISQAIKNSNKISMTKNFLGGDRVETTVTAEKSSFKRNIENVWPHYGYFG